MNSVKAEITKVVLDAIARANEILKRDGTPLISTPIIEFTNRVSKVAGRAGIKHNRPHLQFNLRIAEANFDTFISEIPFHEVAHLMDKYHYGKLGHGPTWKRCCLLLGYKPSRCHNMKVPGMHMYTCPCGQNFAISDRIQRKMQQSSRRILCRKCHGVITPVVDVPA